MKTLNIAQQIWSLLQVMLLIGMLILLYFAIKGFVKKGNRSIKMPTQTEVIDLV